MAKKFKDESIGDNYLFAVQKIKMLNIFEKIEDSFKFKRN